VGKLREWTIQEVVLKGKNKINTAIILGDFGPDVIKVAYIGYRSVYDVSKPIPDSNSLKTPHGLVSIWPSPFSKVF
jgi:hypothetical protein